MVIAMPAPISPMTPHLYVSFYVGILACLSVFGFQSLVLACLFLLRRRQNPPRPADPVVWPQVTVQLPIYNERFVVERLLEAACALDYPSEALSIQLLDDSSDETREVAQRLVERHAARGLQVEYVRRPERKGFKAGALEFGMQRPVGEFLAIFDADFVPPPDFLRRMIPYLVANPRAGMVQARWGHINDGYNLITRSQALLLDGHFMVEQTARSRSGLLFNFNGSGGIWRRAAIEDAGGWNGDTLAEDLDLSYRAQIKGWQLLYLPDLVAPAEIPPQIMAFKRQQHRWACGAIQVLLKLGPALWRAPLSPLQKIFGYIHMSAYLTHPLMLLLLLACLPVILLKGANLPHLEWMSLAGFGPPLLFAVGQWAGYQNWKRRFLYFPALMFLGTGIALNNSAAIIAALSGRKVQFARTPKFHLEKNSDAWKANSYRLEINWTVWGELLLALYASILVVLSFEHLPALIPLTIMFALAFAYTGILGLLEGLETISPSRTRKGTTTAESSP
jgi:cellulose synthase/poly-beta-1,6-N-acetylglucosamine synthase-like glycosyltransferase